MINNDNHVIVERKGSILRLQLNRPEKKNALMAVMYETLIDALKTADSDPAIHVVYLTGTADSYSAGNDLADFKMPPSDAAARFITQIAMTETPLVAAVNGIAVGVGVTMLLHCDLVYVADSALFHFVFVDIGIVPEAAATYLLPRLVGQRKAAELLLLAERFGGSEAVELGIANGVVPLAELDDFAWRQAERLAAKPPEALRQTKQLMKRGTKTAVAEVIPVELTAVLERLQSDETQQIIAALRSRTSK